MIGICYEEQVIVSRDHFVWRLDGLGESSRVDAAGFRQRIDVGLSIFDKNIVTILSLIQRQEDRITPKPLK